MTEHRDPAPATERCEDMADVLSTAALDIASAEDRRTLQQHVAGCLPCDREFHALREAASLLGMGGAVPAAAPTESLRGRTLARAYQESPPGVGHPRPSTRRFLERRASPQRAAVAIALVIAAGSFAWAASLQQQLRTVVAQADVARERAARYDRVVEVLASPRLTTRQLAATAQGAGSGTIYLDPRSGNGMVMIRDLPPLPADRSWQVWFVRGSERVSGGLLYPGPSGAGYAIIAVPPDLQTFESVGITQEPRAGSPAPTSPRVIGSRL